jgi:hypothetical protein
MDKDKLSGRYPTYYVFTVRPIYQPNLTKVHEQRDFASCLDALVTSCFRENWISIFQGAVHQ